MNDNIKGVLLDLDGTLYFKGRSIPGAREAIETLRARRIGVRFLTNTDSRATETLYERVKGYGLDIRVEEIYTPVVAAARYVAGKQGAKVFAMVADEILECFGNRVGNSARSPCW